MRIRIIYWSDLHTDDNGHIGPLVGSLWPLPLRPDYPEPVYDADVLVLAGDNFLAYDFLGPRSGDNQTQRDFATHLVERVFPQFKAVVYVPGNHEYYGTSLSTAIPILKQAFLERGATNLHFLDNDFITIGDLTIYGTTLWSNMESVLKRMEMEKATNDATSIKGFNGTVCHNLHMEAVARLQSFLTRHQTDSALSGNKLVIASHHAPSMQSINPLYSASIPFAYASNLEPLIEANPHINAWIHGHTHRKADYTVGATRILSNPFGCMQHDSNYTFNPHAMLKL